MMLSGMKYWTKKIFFSSKNYEKTLNAYSNELKAYLYSVSSIQFQPDVFLNKVAVV